MRMGLSKNTTAMSSQLRTPAKLDPINTSAAVEITLQDVTPLERGLAVVYSSVVNVPAEKLLGDGALLSSGIDSIGFIKLKKALETALHMETEIPMPVLTSSSSISELCNELTLLGTASVEYDPIVPLVKKGSKLSIFLLPPGAGEFLCWFNLMEYLPARPGSCQSVPGGSLQVQTCT